MALKVSRILHAGYVFEYAGVRVVFDPIFESTFSRNCFSFPAVQFDFDQLHQVKFEAVFISHFHDDHCSLTSLAHIDRSTPIYLFCVHTEMFEIIEALGFTSVHSLRLGAVIQVGGLRVTPHPALDRDVDSIFEVEAGDVRILNVVDSWIDPDTLLSLQKKSPWSLVLWPFQTMRELEVLAPTRIAAVPAELPEEWTAQLQALSAQFLVPSSCQFRLEEWSWYNDVFFPISYEMFARELLRIAPNTKVVRLDPGESILLELGLIKAGPDLTWVKRLEPKELDYVYRPGGPLPSTASIAKNFSALSNSQWVRVREFCEAELIDRFAALEASEDPYFAKSRTWRLSLFDHLGVPTHFHFIIDGAQLRRADAPNSALPTSVGWTTEIPTAKLWAALEEGEQLTSLYLRINSENFSKTIETEVAKADVLEDPLIRCLFANSFGSYQRAQLRELNTHEGTR